MSDDTENFFELRDEFDSQLQAYETAAEGAVPASATDASGELTISIESPDNVLQIHVGARWQEHYKPAELSNAILETYQQFNTARITAWAENVAEAHETEAKPRPMSNEENDRSEAIQARINDAEIDTERMVVMMNRTLDILDELDRGLDESFDIAASRGQTVRAGQTFSRFAEVTLTDGGELVDITFSTRWLETATGQTVTSELRNAMQSARDLVEDESNASKPLDGTPLERLQNLVADREGLISYILGKD